MLQILLLILLCRYCWWFIVAGLLLGDSIVADVVVVLFVADIAGGISVQRVLVVLLLQMSCGDIIGQMLLVILLLQMLLVIFIVDRVWSDGYFVLDASGALDWAVDDPCTHGAEDPRSSSQRTDGYCSVVVWVVLKCTDLSRRSVAW